MGRPVSGRDAEYAPKLSTCSKAQIRTPWISSLLSDLGHEVIVTNARQVRLIGESRKKDDRLDAQNLGAVGPDRS